MVRACLETGKILLKTNCEKWVGRVSPLFCLFAVVVICLFVFLVDSSFYSLTFLKFLLRNIVTFFLKFNFCSVLYLYFAVF